MAKCDICGQEVRPYSMEDLLECYRSPGVRDVCSPCGRWATDRKWSNYKDADALTRQQIAERAGKATPIPLHARLMHYLKGILTA